MFSLRSCLGVFCISPLLVLAGCGGTDGPPIQPDGGDDCPMLCVADADCCQGQVCTDGVCAVPALCPSGCNYECDKAAGKVCKRSTGQCVDGAPPVNCVDDCDCFLGEACEAGVCVANCATDDDCPAGQQCADGACEPEACQTKEDCDPNACLICKAGHCTEQPVVCQGDADCCVGMECSFGGCVPIEEGCQADSDCEDPDLPLCVDHKCVPAEAECQIDADCPEPGQVCQDQQCVTQGCTQETCQSGQWCDQATGLCKPGCDSNDDCLAPETCDYGSHQCGQVDCCGGICTPGSQVCDPQTCLCRDVCIDDLDCPADYTCRQADGQCICTAAACPAGFHCDAGSGECVADAEGCDPADFSQPITCDASTSGIFEVGCESTQRPGSYAKQFTFEGTAGSTVIIDLSSGVDAYLYLLGPGGAVVASNDDGGDNGSDARITYALATDGTYTIEATTYGPGNSGSFDLSLDCVDASDCTEPMSCGDVVGGVWTPACVSTLQSGSYARWYTFQGTAGYRVTIDLSSDTDTYLYLLDAAGAVLASDDDGGSFTDSRIEFWLPADGTYTIEATTLRAGREDDFSLSLICAQCEQPITCGQVIAETFEPGCEAVNRPGRYSKVFLFDADADQEITFDLRSNAVDTYLFVYAPSGEYVTSNDDADGSTTDSRISGTLLTSGVWFLEATTYDPNETGPFEIEVTCH